MFVFLKDALRFKNSTSALIQFSQTIWGQEEVMKIIAITIQIQYSRFVARGRLNNAQRWIKIGMELHEEAGIA